MESENATRVVTLQLSEGLSIEVRRLIFIFSAFMMILIFCVILRTVMHVYQFVIKHNEKRRKKEIDIEKRAARGRSSSRKPARSRSSPTSQSRKSTTSTKPSESKELSNKSSKASKSLSKSASRSRRSNKSKKEKKIIMNTAQMPSKRLQVPLNSPAVPPTLKPGKEFPTSTIIHAPVQMAGQTPDSCQPSQSAYPVVQASVTTTPSSVTNIPTSYTTSSQLPEPAPAYVEENKNKVTSPSGTIPQPSTVDPPVLTNGEIPAVIQPTSNAPIGVVANEHHLQRSDRPPAYSEVVSQTPAPTSNPPQTPVASDITQTSQTPTISPGL